MNIAFISYEFPPDTADGGIATYVRQASGMLARAGHRVEVFAASRTREDEAEEEGVLVHRVFSPEQSDFAARAAAAFADRHRAEPFDVLEGPDYGADAREAVRLVRGIPLVLKLHTPRYFASRLDRLPRRDYLRVCREYLGALRRGRRPWWHYDRERDPEFAHACEADEIAAPSKAIEQRVFGDWELDPRKISCFPYPYVPSHALLTIPIETATNRITFLGRFERRKGIFDLARAIPKVWRRRPDAHFRLVGRSEPQALEQVRSLLGKAVDSVEFCGPVALDQVPVILANTDICVFPSLWENFAMVCLEAMSAARGIVASEAGGMAEMLDGGSSGLLTPPAAPNRLAAQILMLLDDPARRKRLGQAARRRVLNVYNEQQVCERQVASYARAIARRSAAGPR